MTTNQIKIEPNTENSSPAKMGQTIVRSMSSSTMEQLAEFYNIEWNSANCSMVLDDMDQTINCPISDSALFSVFYELDWFVVSELMYNITFILAKCF